MIRISRKITDLCSTWQFKQMVSLWIFKLNCSRWQIYCVESPLERATVWMKGAESLSCRPLITLTENICRLFLKTFSDKVFVLPWVSKRWQNSLILGRKLQTAYWEGHLRVPFNQIEAPGVNLYIVVLISWFTAVVLIKFSTRIPIIICCGILLYISKHWPVSPYSNTFPALHLITQKIRSIMLY